MSEEPEEPHWPRQREGEIEPAPVADFEAGEQAALYRVETFEGHIGPLPSARVLAEYAEVMPDLPERVVRMAEREQDHRHQMERAPTRLAMRGQVFAFATVLVVLAFCGFLVTYDQVVLAGVIAALDLVGLVTVFVVGRARSRTEKTSPDDEEHPPNELEQGL